MKNKNKGESKLSIFEHPSTFEKPGIEMVNEFREREKDTKELKNSIDQSNEHQNSES